MAVQQLTLPPPIVIPDMEVYYPDSDGKPMAETELHVLVITDLYTAIEILLAGRFDVFLAMNLFWYYQEGNPLACKAPDVMVVLGVPRQPRRRSFKSWVEGAVPAVIFEITSNETWSDDWVQKRALYATLGVREYFLFDPLEEYLERQLMGFRLAGQEYAPLVPADDGSLVSDVLGVRLCSDGEYLRLIDLATGRAIPHRHEMSAATTEADQRAEQEHQRAEQERQRAERERQRAEREQQRAEVAEAELARLRALLAKQSSSNEGHA